MGTKNKQLFKRLGLFVTIGIVLASTLVTLIPESTSAKKVSDMTVAEEASSATYYAAVSYCVRDIMLSTIAASNASGGTNPGASWFNANDHAKNYVFNASSNSIVREQRCRDIFRAALGLWGWGTDYPQFLRDMEYTFNNDPGKPEWSRSKGGGQSLVDRFWQQVQTKVYSTRFDIELRGTKGFGVPLSAAAESLLLTKSFGGTVCKGSVVGLYPSGITNAEIRELVKNGGTKGDGSDKVQYRLLKWFNASEGILGDYGIRYSLGNTNSLLIYGHSDGPRLQMQCSQMAERISALSPDVAHAAAKESCRDAGVLTLLPGGNADAVLGACADGLLNPTPHNFCTIRHIGPNNTQLRKACYFGQGNEAGEACVINGKASESLFKACIDGSKNKTDGYCAATYVDGYQGSTFVSREAERQACVLGTTFEISNAVVAPPLTGDIDCTTSPDAEGCQVADTSCAVAGIGWIVCPIINFLAEVGDSAYAVLANDFLETNVNIVAVESADGTPNGTYIAWGIIRTVANVGFVIVFLFIIFSQLTGAGVSNYGVKKMLPRLVIGVILVNLSFTVCQLAVDVSNILGHSINGVFEGVAEDIDQSYDREDPLGSVSGEEGTLAGTFGTILSIGVVGVGGYFLLSAGGTLLVAALLGLLATLLILVLRQVIIVLAIVIAPIVFVAWILPNTENLFKQWLKIFAGMLGLFPLVALIFGGATLASAVIGSIAVSNDDMLWQLIASLLPAVALLAVIPAIQGALKAIPALGQLAGKLTSRANANLGKKARESYQGSVIGRGAAIRKQGRESFRNKKFAERIAKGGASRFFAQGVGITQESRAAQKTLLQSALATEQKARAEEVSAARAVIEHANLSGAQRQALARGEAVTINGTQHKGGDMQKAAIDMQMQTGSYDEVHELVSKSGGALLEHSQRIQQGLIANGWGAKSPAFAGKNLDKIAQGGVKSEADIDTAMLSAISEGRYTAEALAGMNNSARQRVIDAAKKSSDPKHLAALRAAAAQIASTPELQGKVAGNAEAEKHIYTDLV